MIVLCLIERSLSLSLTRPINYSTYLFMQGIRLFFKEGAFPLNFPLLLCSFKTKKCAFLLYFFICVFSRFLGGYISGITYGDNSRSRDKESTVKVERVVTWTDVYAYLEVDCVEKCISLRWRSLPLHGTGFLGFLGRKTGRKVRHRSMKRQLTLQQTTTTTKGGI